MSEAKTMDGAKVIEVEVEGEDDGNIRLDPFQQPPILKALFEQMPVEDLASCRLVSKLWCKESQSAWRSEATLKFDKERIVSTRDYDFKRATSLREFLDHWDAGEWGSCPFKKFNLRWWKFEAKDVGQQRFLELVGGHITSLTLENCSFVGRENFQRIIYQAFPKLQFLKMHQCGVDNVGWKQPAGETLAYTKPNFGVHRLKSLEISYCVPDSLMDMLSHFHKVKSLCLRLSRGGPAYYRELLETIRLIRAQDQTKLPLKDFDLDFHFDGLGLTAACSIELVKLHKQLNLPLQRLKIDCDPPEEDEDWNLNDIIRNILQHHSSTLEYLGFTGEEEDRQGLCKSFPFGFYLDDLEQLAIQSPCFTDNLNYLRYTPNLCVLEIEKVSLNMSESDNLFSNSSQLEIKDWTLPSLTHLTFNLPVSVGNLRKLMKWMPNVQCLGAVKLDDVKFSMVCDRWPNLTALIDYGDELTDEGVLGRENVHEAGCDEETQSVPNITQLKNLAVFRTCSSNLTSASVHHGFLKLANLQVLWFGQHTTLDDGAKAALEERKIPLGISSGVGISFRRVTS